MLRTGYKLKPAFGLHFINNGPLFMIVEVHEFLDYSALRSLSSLNNLQNSGNNFLWKYGVDKLKIIIIIIV
jgi:hypothetical protein